MHIDTKCLQEGYSPKSGEPRVLPIYQSTTYKYDSSDALGDLFDLKSEGYFYTRLANPTVDAFEKKLAELDGGVLGIATASGMSATLLAILNIAGAGDNIVASRAIYGGSYNLFSVTLPKYGIQTRFFDPDDSEEEIDKLVDEQIETLVKSEDDWESIGEKLPEALAAGMKNSLELGAIDEATTAVANEVISGLNAKLSAGGVSGLGFGFDSSVLDKAANSGATYAAARSGSDETGTAPTTLQIVTPDGQTLAQWLFPKINDLLGKTTTLQLRGYAT